MKPSCSLSCAQSELRCRKRAVQGPSACRGLPACPGDLSGGAVLTVCSPLEDAALLNNMVQNFGMLDLVKKVLAGHKCQMDRSREQYARDLAGMLGDSPVGQLLLRERWRQSPESGRTSRAWRRHAGKQGSRDAGPGQPARGSRVWNSPCSSL